MAEPTVAVVGLQGGEWFGAAAGNAVDTADVVIGSRRHLEALGSGGGALRLSYGPIGELLDQVGEHLGRGANVCVLASGDPGFFGAARILTARFGPAVTIHPAPSAVSLAFARAGMGWDDATVVSAHGRSLDAGLTQIIGAAKAAVLTSPDTPPEAIGRALDGAALRADVWVCSRLGHSDETVVRCDVAGLAGGSFDPLSVVIIRRVSAEGHDAPAVAWRSGPGSSTGFGRPVSSFAHRAGMITKPEVRAVVLSKLDLHGGVTLWDVGAGSGAVAVEAAGLAPGLRAWAIERRADDCRRIAANAEGLAVTVMEAEAPGCFDALPDPDRVFIGGGGIEVLEAVCARVAPGTPVVASFATMDRAVAAAGRLGNLVQIGINRAAPIGVGGALRLDADNPVFVAWGVAT